MKKGFFAAFLCALIMVLLPAAVYAMDGTGTEDNPYQISTEADLEEFRDIVNGENGKTRNSSACAILKNDIVLNNDVLNSDGSLNEEKASTFEEWTPIGTASAHYTGTFDGNGKTISGIYINGGDVYKGLFGYIGEDGEVKNLGLVDSSIHGNSYVGSIAGISKGSIKDCYNEGSVSGINYIGGIVGSGTGSITNCNNKGKVNSKSEVGGIAGKIEGGASIEDCYNEGSVSGNNEYVGGIAGRSYISSITDCYNEGDVSSTGNFVGGIIGSGTGSSIEDCYNTGDVSGGYVGVSRGIATAAE